MKHTFLTILLVTIVGGGMIGCKQQPSMPKEVAKDSISANYSFLGKRIIMNDSVMQQIECIASCNSMLSVEGNVLRIGNTKWGINIHQNGIVLFSSTEIDSPEMREVYNYLVGIYGEPYDQDPYESGELNDCKWYSNSSQNVSLDSESTLIHMRRVHSDEGGTFLMFN